MGAARSAGGVGAIARRIARWRSAALARELEERGHALPGRLLSTRECDSLLRCFERDPLFRSTIEMGPRRYGEGRYRYFADPLPDLIAELRSALYPPLAEIANDWWERLGEVPRFEPTLDAFLARCHRAGQTRPTPLLLRYGEGGFNRLHQDVYGDIAFPLQVTILLSDPADFSGGAFLLTEQRARMQSRGWSITLGRGEAVIFPNAVRPVPGKRGVLRARIRHGVSDITGGERTALGVIFHDAR